MKSQLDLYDVPFAHGLHRPGASNSLVLISRFVVTEKPAAPSPSKLNSGECQMSAVFISAPQRQTETELGSSPTEHSEHCLQRILRHSWVHI
jgi:hypothetical protein